MIEFRYNGIPLFWWQTLQNVPVKTDRINWQGEIYEVLYRLFEAENIIIFLNKL